MKRICFGTLLNLIYQARGSGVKYKSICSSVFLVYGCTGMENRDNALPSHLKSGRDNVPPDVNNGKLRSSQIKDFLLDNFGSYVFSRSKVKCFEERPRGALGVRALQRFQKAYRENAESVLGELMLYVFLEQELNAPKIMSKIEFSDSGGIASKSDGIHLLVTTEFGRPFNQLIFGASNIQGSLVAAIDRAFERISTIDDNYEIEFRTVENYNTH